MKGPAKFKITVATHAAADGWKARFVKSEVLTINARQGVPLMSDLVRFLASNSSLLDDPNVPDRVTIHITRIKRGKKKP